MSEEVEAETIRFLREKLAEAQAQNKQLQEALDSGRAEIKGAINLIIDFLAEYSSRNPVKTEGAIGDLKNFIRERCDSGTEQKASPNP